MAGPIAPGVWRNRHSRHLRLDGQLRRPHPAHFHCGGWSAAGLGASGCGLPTMAIGGQRNCWVPTPVAGKRKGSSSSNNIGGSS